ncbi:MAG TPA: hypothetical protein VLK36_13055 [Gaiellaceae bacterium]|nr:hypothetical protein [Gaiellaceae bacterium]
MTLKSGSRYRVLVSASSRTPSFDGRYVGAVELAGAVRGHEFSVTGASERAWRPILLVDEIREVEELADAA